MYDFRCLADGRPAPDFPAEMYEQIDAKRGATVPDFRIERYPTFSENVTALAVVDRTGHMRGMLVLETETITDEDEMWLLQRVQGAATDSPRPDLRIVG